MLANQEDFDRDVKRVLQEVNGEEIPLDFLVDIEQRLDQLEKKKKRRMFLWFFTGIVLASGLTFGLLRENGTSNISSKTATQKNPKDTIKAASIAPKVSPKEYKSIQVNTVQIVTTQPSGVTRNTLSNSPIKETVTRSTGGNQSDVIPWIRSKENSATVPRQIATTKAPQNDQGISSNQKNEVPPVSETATSTPTRMDERSNPISVPVTTIPEIAPLINDVQANTNSTSINPVYPEPGILPIEKEKWVQTFGFFTGVSGIRSSVKIPDPTAMNSFPGPSEKYLSIRNGQERSTSSIDLSLRTSWMKHHFLIQTGVDYFEWGEQLQYDYNIVYDGVNRYSYVSVPLYLGYRQTWKKVELSASVGSSIGAVIKRDGYYLQSNLTTIAVEQASDWTSTGYLQFELSYLMENYRFSIAPTYRKALTHVIYSNQTVNSYDSFGLQMGISVILK
jgi:hypothetical protein